MKFFKMNFFNYLPARYGARRRGTLARRVGASGAACAIGRRRSLRARDAATPQWPDSMCQSKLWLGAPVAPGRCRRRSLLVRCALY